MGLSNKDIEKYMYDAGMLQKAVMDYLENGIENGISIEDSTNPFSMLFESSATMSVNSIIETNVVTRKLHPKLAKNKSELYHHISDDELPNMFATPSETSLVFYLNIASLKMNGYREIGKNYVETLIPSNTEVIVANTTFTLLNDILIRLYDEGNIFVEQQITDSDIAINNISILNTVIQNDSEGISWLLFETIFKQVKRINITDTIIVAEGYKKDILINDQYYYLDFKYKNSYTNNQYISIDKSFNKSYIDPDVPTVYIEKLENSLKLEIPDTYIMNNNISGNVLIDVYTTKGNIFLPINKYSIGDFNIELKDTGKTQQSATIPNIPLMVHSRFVVDGGKNESTLEELRDSIVSNTTGNLNLPISDLDIKRKGSFDGFEIFKAFDILTDRIYIASKNISSINSDLINARVDIFFNTVNMVIGDTLQSNNIIVKDDIVIIKSNTVFLEDNGICKIVNDSELEYINNLSLETKTEYFKNKKYFFTPYFYILDKTDTILNSRIYELNKPSLSNLKITGKNNNIIPRVNTDKFTIIKTDIGYDLYFTIIGNSEFQKLDPTKIKAQLSMNIYDTDEKIYFESTFNQDTGYLIFHIETDFYIDKKDNINIISGMSNLYTKGVTLNTEIILYIYTVDNAVIDTKKYLHNELKTDTGDLVTVFSKENIKMVFGNEIKYMWNKVVNTYTERQYLKYTNDVPMVYEETVYEVNPATGSIFTCVDNNNDGIADDVTYNVLHNIGDPVLDNDGNPVFKHRKGDVIINDNGLPTIDLDLGVLRQIDILMLEYEFSLATSLPYKNYLNMVTDVMSLWFFDKLVKLNELVLENTEILYKSYKTSLPVKIKINNINRSIPYSVIPKVNLYTSNETYTQDELMQYKIIVGKILHEHLDKKNILISSIKEQIINEIGDHIVGVKIEGIDPINNIDVISIVDSTTRLVMDKQLVLNTNNDLIVDYNLDLEINTI